jgi:hypothetical protein
MMHLFMAHGVDHLCWRGGQQPTQEAVVLPLGGSLLVSLVSMEASPLPQGHQPMVPPLVGLPIQVKSG